MDRASSDALRPNRNSAKTEDQYGISNIRETLAASARRWFPSPERRSSLPAKHKHHQDTCEEVVLGQNHELLQRERQPADRARARAAAERIIEQREWQGATRSHSA